LTGSIPAGFPGCCNPTNVAVAGLTASHHGEKRATRRSCTISAGSLLAVVARTVRSELQEHGCPVDLRGRVYVADTVKLAIIVLNR